MKRILFLLMLFTLVGLQARAQKEIDDQSGFWERVYFGGNVGLQVGNVETSIVLSPLAGYMFTQKFSAGLGLTYQYYKAEYQNFKYSTNLYGGRLFGRYNINDNIFAYGEYESLNVDVPQSYDPVKQEIIYDKQWVPGVFVGGGLMQRMGPNLGFQVMALYNLAYDTYRSPYPSPFILRVGFTL